MRRITFGLAYALFLLAGTTWAQSFLGSIKGTVLDASGGIIPQAKVTLTETLTLEAREVVTNADGQYEFANIPPGVYLVTVSVAGFKTAKSGEINLTPQQTQGFDARLEVGSAAETIEIAASAPTVNTENALLAGLVTRDEFKDVPLNSRSIFQFLYLSSNNYLGDGSSYSVGGLRGNNTNFTVDGVNANSSMFGNQSGGMNQVSFEGISEMSVLYSNNSAEFPNVASVIIATRGGENKYHGSAFYLTDNNALDARSFFAPSLPKGPIDHIFGGSLGGPITIPKVYNGHDKTFFYFTWEGSRSPAGSWASSSVPTAPMRSGDFSALPGSTIVKDPTTGQPFPGNVIPANRISPVSLALQNLFYPVPNSGPAASYKSNYLTLLPNSSYYNQYHTRVDHYFGPRDILSGRLSLDTVPYSTPQWSNNLGEFYWTGHRNFINSYISETHILNANTTNEFRIGFSRDYSTEVGAHNGSQVVKQVGLQGVNTNNDLTGVPVLSFNNFTGFSEQGTYFYRAQTIEMLDNLTRMMGRHHLKTGVLLRHNEPAISSNVNDFGAMTFSGFASGFDYADFLLGLPATSTLTYPAPNSYYKFNFLGLYVQDDIRVTPRLTLNFGLRWEYEQPPTEQNNMRSTYDPSTRNVVVTNQQVAATLISPFFSKTLPVVTAQQAGYPAKSLLDSQWKNFAPRFSFAWLPFGRPNFVVRGGHGIFYSPLISTLLSPFSGGAFSGGGPFLSSLSSTNTITNGVPYFQFPNPFVTTGKLPTQNIDAVAPNIKTPNTQQWNLTIQRELPGKIVAQVSYRGIRSNQILYERNLNTPPASTNAANQKVYYWDPAYNTLDYTEDGGIQKMNALDSSLERKFGSGLTFQSQWTWAKDLSDAGEDGERGPAILDPYYRHLDMSNASYVPRHRWVTQAIYYLPFGAGRQIGANWNPLAQHLIGGWELSSTFVDQTGFFSTPTFSGPDVTNNRTTTGRANCAASWQVANPGINEWFNPAAFTIPASGNYGTCPASIIAGPALRNVNIGFFRNFRLSERAKMQFRATATDAFNHPIFAGPNTNISSTYVGTITAVTTKGTPLSSGSRQIELGVRIDF